MKAVPYGLLADVDASSHPHVPSNDAGRGCSCRLMRRSSRGFVFFGRPDLRRSWTLPVAV